MLRFSQEDCLVKFILPFREQILSRSYILNICRSRLYNDHDYAFYLGHLKKLIVRQNCVEGYVVGLFSFLITGQQMK